MTAERDFNCGTYPRGRDGRFVTEEKRKGTLRSVAEVARLVAEAGFWILVAVGQMVVGALLLKLLLGG